MPKPKAQGNTLSLALPIIFITHTHTCPVLRDSLAAELEPHLQHYSTGTTGIKSNPVVFYTLFYRILQAYGWKKKVKAQLSRTTEQLRGLTSLQTIFVPFPREWDLLPDASKLLQETIRFF